MLTQGNLLAIGHGVVPAYLVPGNNLISQVLAICSKPSPNGIVSKNVIRTSPQITAFC